jgi:hypothetical protein
MSEMGSGMPLTSLSVRAGKSPDSVVAGPLTMHPTHLDTVPNTLDCRSTLSHLNLAALATPGPPT